MDTRTVIKAAWLLTSCLGVATLVAVGTNAAERRTKLEKELEEAYGVEKVLLYPGQNIAHVVIGHNYELYRTIKIKGETHLILFPRSKAPFLERKTR